jgi:hypothetical protein
LPLYDAGTTYGKHVLPRLLTLASCVTVFGSALVFTGLASLASVVFAGNSSSAQAGPCSVCSDIHRRTCTCMYTLLSSLWVPLGVVLVVWSCMAHGGTHLSSRHRASGSALSTLIYNSQCCFKGLVVIARSLKHLPTCKPSLIP